MKKTTLKIITSETLMDLVERVNQSKEEFFATQPIQKIDGTWVMFCYSQSGQGRGEVVHKESPPPTDTLENEKPSKQLATKSQLNYYKKNKILIPLGLTKFEAWKVISEHKK